MLREVWCDVLKVEKLPADHFNVYKNITRFSHVDIVDIFNEFKDKIHTQKTNKFGLKLKRRKKKIDKIKFLRDQDAIAFCTEKEFFKVKNKLLQPSKTKIIDDKVVYRNFGIPQGSPISSVLANMYLLHFDKLINDFTTSVGGIYRRYSDDMIVVCPLNQKANLVELVYSEIKKYKLEIQPTKTQIFQFEYKNGKLECGEEYQDGKLINWNKNFIYLGFEFDGQSVLLKSASLAGFYRKMKRSIRRAKYYSKKTKKEIFKRRLLKRHSYIGAKRTRKYIWNENKKKFIKSEYYNWGNFLSYAFKAADIMINNKIKRQTRKHWNILNREINKK
ncbi:reverse transcriptase domain-containing protein [Flavobacterium psychrophilum]|uniref:reverse transcriptase domain-containing protein n=1 Tax=Flavobacterium psychrophilum TaxID=96345 RepID=UPI001430B567|nr:reverse transcriptase domain-containing protein [Flavobacterium psychrophilum]